MSKVKVQSDYFANHEVAVKWPFTIYHNPIEDAVQKLLKELRTKTQGMPQALNLGCGWFGTYPQLKSFARWAACDLDPRCVEVVKKSYPEIDAFTCEPTPALTTNTYDVIVAKEVIEHVLNPKEWVQSLLRGLKPGGHLVLSTPNYGISLLPIIEYTILEVIARTQGFSRFDIHPTKFTYNRLKRLLTEAAPEGSLIRIDRLSLGMVLFASVELPK